MTLIGEVAALATSFFFARTSIIFSSAGRIPSLLRPSSSRTISPLRGFVLVIMPIATIVEDMYEVAVESVRTHFCILDISIRHYVCRFYFDINSLIEYSY